MAVYLALVVPPENCWHVPEANCHVFPPEAMVIPQLSVEEDNVTLAQFDEPHGTHWPLTGETVVHAVAQLRLPWTLIAVLPRRMARARPRLVIRDRLVYTSSGELCSQGREVLKLRLP